MLQRRSSVLHGSRSLSRAVAAPTPQLLPAQRTRSRRQLKHTTEAVAVPDAIQALAESAAGAHPGLATGAAVTGLVMTAGVRVLQKGLTSAGIVNAFALGTLLYGAFGAGGFSLLCLYFLFGTAVTKVKLEQKQKEGIAEARSGRRGPSSVWGSGSAGAFCAVAALATGNYSLWQIGFVASFTSKLSDTVSSEIGKAYGKTTYLVTNLKLVPRGTEGAVSVEGTLAGLAAAAAYATVALAIGQTTPSDAVLVTAAAFLANVFESYLGAVVQGKVEWLNNDLVNVIQIAVAAALAVLAKFYL
ncbi:integral membrane protein [Scenedesmus sp. NREL 46B-D3]|nr:integral membrane protein [Scenedesmus sp. NREL 46B-D3]